MLIKQKLTLNTAVVVGLMLLMFGLFSWTLTTVEQLDKGKELVMNLEADMLAMRRYEKDFLARNDLKYVEPFEQNAVQVQETLLKLQALADKFGLTLPELGQLQAKFRLYQDTFHQVVETRKRVGLRHDQGLEGELRRAVHSIEQQLKATGSDRLLVTMLQLRRAEKDFMLRSDEKYLARFDALIARLKQQLQDTGSDPALSGYADLYREKFAAFAQGRKALGLNSDQGLWLKMRRTIQSTESLLKSAEQKVKQQMTTHLERAHLLSLLVFLGVLASTVAATILLARSIFRPIRTIQQDVLRIHQQHDLRLRVAEDGRDEITEMAASLNTMLAGFQQVIRQVNQAVDTMNVSTDELSRNAGRTRDDITRQQSETDQVATAVTEMVSTVEEIARNTELMANNAHNTHTDAQQGLKQVQRAIQLIRHLSENLESSVATVTQLSEQSQTIGSVLGVIQDIAEQTNLLALNAAIEAARAGEQGRGFAVVADEVRALAGRTQEATQEIDAIIRSLQEKTQATVDMIHACREEGLESREEAASAEAVLAGITQDVTDISDRATQVAAAIEEQSSVANEVGKNIVVIRDITEDAAQAVQRNSEASHDISDQAEELQRVVSAFKV